MKKNGFIFAIYALLVGIIVWQQFQINSISKRYNEEKILFDANYGEVVRLKDDLGAYEDSCRRYRKEIQELIISD